MVTVIETTIKNDLCCGCGTCVALCPSHTLNMEWNKYGALNPVKIHDCVHECGLCLKVCPFIDKNPNEDVIGKLLYGSRPGIQYRSETGYYVSSGVGAVADEQRRWNSASGGLATWFLEKILVEGIVDAVLCVKKSDDGKSLYHFFVAKTPEDVHRSAGSAYYPTEMSSVITYVLENPGKYAVIGLPCFVKALRLASMKNKELRDRIIIIAGLTCGQMKNTNFTKYIAHLSGLDEEIKEVAFRCKSSDRPANNFFFNFTGVSGKNTHFFWGGELSRVWGSRAFTLPACDFCDDIFAECADVTFMDAWLPDYRSDSRGTSLCILRSDLISSIFTSGIDAGEIGFNNILIERVITSQSGVVEIKRPKLAYRLYLSQSHIQKRVLPSKHLPLMERRRVAKALMVRKAANDIYIRHEGESRMVELEMNRLLHQGFVEKKAYFGWRACRYVFRKVRARIQKR